METFVYDARVQEWLDGIQLDQFIRTHFDHAPIAQSAAAMSAVPLFGWETLERILRMEPSADILVVARNELLEIPAPRNRATLSTLIGRGIGLVIRHAERCDAGLSELAGAFAQDLGGEAHVQLFITPAGTYGFGWHYDIEHVFIAQTDGVKDYFFRANSVAPASELALDFSRFSQEHSPVATSRLIPGDWLYIPARWWHTARCVETSLSISIGVRI